MNQRTESASHHGHGKSPISYGVAVVACLTIATDYIQTFGIVPILPLYFQEIDLFDAQLPIFQSGSNVLSQNFSSFQTSPTDEYLIIENVSYSRIEASFHKTLETPIIQDGSTQQTHMSAIGYVVLIKWAAQIMICPLVGRMIDQYGVRWPAVFGFIIEIVFCAVFVLADSVLMFILARAIQGMASAFVVTSMLSWLTFSYSGETRKTITGYAFVTIDMGVSFGPPLIGTLYGLCDIVWTMVVQSMLFATLFVAFMLLCKPQSQLSTASTSDYHPLALDEDPEPPDEDPEPPTEDPEPPATRQGIVSLLKDRRMICIAVQLVILDWAVIAWAPILPVFMDDQLGISSPFIVGNIWLVTVLPSVCSIRVFVFFNTMAPQRMFHLTVSSYLIIAGTVLLTAYATWNVWILALWMIIVTFFSAGLLYALNSTIIELIDHLTPAGGVSNYGSGMAIQEMSLSLGCMIAPLISCSLMSISGFKTVNIFIAFLYLMGAFCVLPTRELLNSDKNSQDDIDDQHDVVTLTD